MTTELVDTVVTILADNKTVVAIATVTVGGLGLLSTLMSGVMATLLTGLDTVRPERETDDDIDDDDISAFERDISSLGLRTNIDNVLRDEILAEHRRGTGVATISVKLGLPMHRVLSVLDNEPVPFTSAKFNRPVGA